MKDRDSRRESYRLQILATLMIGVLVWTFGRTTPDVSGPAEYHLTAGTTAVPTPTLRSDSALPALRAILVPVAVLASPMFEEVTDIAIGRPRKALSRTAPHSAPHSVSVSERAVNQNRYSLRL